jgi:hypothetical protein
MIRRFGDTVFGNSFTGLLQAPFQIVRQSVSNNGHSQTLHKGISPNMDIAPYHGYKGLSSMGVGQGIKSIPDTKHPIYKHYISKHHMFDMRIFGYEGLADMKV